MPFASTQEAVAALAARSASLADLREIVTRFPELRPVVAAYPQTDQPLLDWLGSLHDPLVEAQLAKRSSISDSNETRVQPSPAPRGIAPVEQTVVQPSVQADPSRAASPFQPGYPERIAQPFQPGYPGGAAQPSRPPVPPSGGFAGPPAKPVTGVEGDHRANKSRLLPAVLFTVLALILVGGGVGAAFAGGLFGGGAKVAAPAVTASSVKTPTTPSSTTSDTASPGMGSSGGPSASPTTPASTGIVCWDGARVTAGSTCPPPSGKDADWSYLKYAYPSVDTHDDCTQVASTGKGTYKDVTVMWECELGDALIRYRYWASAADAEQHYGAKFTKKSTLATYTVAIAGAPANGWIKTDKDTVKGPGGIKRVVLTMWLPDQHLSLSVEGNTKASMWAAFDLARIRPLDQMLGHPEGTDADEAPITAVKG